MTKKYRNLKIKLEADGRFDVYEGDYVIAENFRSLSLAMEWVDLEFYG